MLSNLLSSDKFIINGEDYIKQHFAPTDIFYNIYIVRF